MLENITMPYESPCAQLGGGGPLTYDFDRSEFWRAIPKWSDIDSETFGDFRWQQRNSVTSIPGIKETLGEKASSALISDISSINNVPPVAFSKEPYDIDPLSFSSPNNSNSYFFTSSKAPLRTTKGDLCLLDNL